MEFAKNVCFVNVQKSRNKYIYRVLYPKTLD